MNYLVTGGAGFIGSHIAEALIKRGDSVRVFDNMSTGNKANLQALGPRAKFMRGDLRRPRDVAKAVRGIDIIFHEAALRSVPRSVDDPSTTNDVNITGTLNLLNAARRAKVKRLVYASSSSLYGDNKTYPQVETMRAAPLSPYAVAKVTAEYYCVVFAKTYGLETVSLRYFNVFGPRQHPQSQYAAVIPKFMDCAKRGMALDVHWDGKQSRDFTYIGNVVEANLLAAKKPGIGGEFFNIACGASHSLLDIIRELEHLSGHALVRRHHPMRAGDVRKTWANISKARRLMGYKPKIDLREGLRRTWEWFNG
jgi:nucleoside-diphosphate-sugar epimerase